MLPWYMIVQIVRIDLLYDVNLCYNFLLNTIYFVKHINGLDYIVSV